MALSAHLRGVLRRAREKKWKCRSCGQKKTAMALEYEGNEGLCRKCLNEYLPLALRGGKKVTRRTTK